MTSEGWIVLAMFAGLPISALITQMLAATCPAVDRWLDELASEMDYEP